LGDRRYISKKEMEGFARRGGRESFERKNLQPKKDTDAEKE